MTTTDQLLEIIRSHPNKEEVPDILHNLIHGVKQDQEAKIHALKMKLEEEKTILNKLKGV